MIKKLIDFMVMSVTVFVWYTIYFFTMAIFTFILGLPIGIGVYTIIRALQLLLNGA